MVRAVRPFRSLSMARGCARIDSRLDTVKISLAGRVEVHHARFLAVIGVRKTFPHGLDPERTSTAGIDAAISGRSTTRLCGTGFEDRRTALEIPTLRSSCQSSTSSTNCFAHS